MTLTPSPAAEAVAVGDAPEPAEISEEGEQTEFPASDVPSEARAYVLNTRSRQFHLPECSSVSSILEENRADFYGTREEALQQGYEPCGRCNP